MDWPYYLKRTHRTFCKFLRYGGCNTNITYIAPERDEFEPVSCTNYLLPATREDQVNFYLPDRVGAMPLTPGHVAFDYSNSDETENPNQRNTVKNEFDMGSLEWYAWEALEGRHLWRYDDDTHFTGNRYPYYQSHSDVVILESPSEYSHVKEWQQMRILFKFTPDHSKKNSGC
jgi:hypothetical protein